MGDIALRGPELKKLVKIAKKRDLNFAYCPGNDPKEDVFVLDRKKNPEVIGRAARGEGTGTKAAIGTARVKGRVMMMTCLKELPQMAKKLKKFLKSEKVPMNIVIMDKDGNILEEDIEDLPEDPDLDGNDDDETEEVQAGGNDTDAAEDDAARLKKLTARAQTLQTAIGALPKNMSVPMTKRFQGLLETLKKGDLDLADKNLTKLETAVEMLAAKADGSAGQDANAGTDLSGLSEQAEALAKQIEALGNENGTARLLAAHGLLLTQIEAGNAKKATSTAKALQDAIAKAEGQKSGEGQDANGAEGAWAAARTELEPIATDLLQRNMGDVSKMRAVLGFFVEKGEAGDFASAMKAVPGLKKLIAEAQASTQTEAEAAVPAGVVHYYKARLDWRETRSTLNTEMTKLEKAIVDTCDPSEFPNVANDANRLFGYLEKLDGRLEAALEALEQEADDAKRETLKGQAAKVLAEYKQELNTDFFKAVDGDNGFTPVNVRGAAIASLRKVEDALNKAAA